MIFYAFIPELYNYILYLFHSMSWSHFLTAYTQAVFGCKGCKGCWGTRAYGSWGCPFQVCKNASKSLRMLVNYNQIEGFNHTGTAILHRLTRRCDTEGRILESYYVRVINPNCRGFGTVHSIVYRVLSGLSEQTILDALNFATILRGRWGGFEWWRGRSTSAKAGKAGSSWGWGWRIRKRTVAENAAYCCSVVILRSFWYFLLVWSVLTLKHAKLIVEGVTRALFLWQMTLLKYT